MQTSPALSLDGKQVAFVQSSSGGVASLVLLKWASASVTAGSPVTLTTYYCQQHIRRAPRRAC